MRVIERAVYRGPHLYSQTPMIRIQLDLGALEDWPTDRLAGFPERLVALLPGLHTHGCSLGAPGGLEERMRKGTWLGHVAGHVALELQTLEGHPVTRGKTRSVSGRPGVYNVMFGYEEEEVGLLAGRQALELVQSLLPEGLPGIEGLDRLAEGDGTPFELGAALERLTRLARRVGLGPSTRAIVRAARHPCPQARPVEPDPARLRPEPEAHPREPHGPHGPHLRDRHRDRGRQGPDQAPAVGGRPAGAEG